MHACKYIVTFHSFHESTHFPQKTIRDTPQEDSTTMTIGNLEVTSQEVETMMDRADQEDTTATDVVMV